MREGIIREHPMIRLNRKKVNTQCYNILRRTIEMNRRDSGDEAGWVISEKGELLFWIPTITRLCDVRETRRLLEVDCEDVCWGDKWIGCYKL